MAVATAKPPRVNKLRSIAKPHCAIWTAPLGSFLCPALVLQAKNLRRFVVEKFRTSAAKCRLHGSRAMVANDPTSVSIHGERTSTK